MKEKLIEFKTAKLAKEKGYNVPCKHQFGTFEDEDYVEFSYTDRGSLPSDVVKYGMLIDSINRPTQTQLQKWLREEHNMQVNTFPYNDGKWEFIIFFLDEPLESSDGFKNKMSLDFEPYKWGSYEEALEAGLYQALKLIK